MAKIIEASAVISARAGDLSGIDRIAAKLSSVSKTGQQVKNAMAGVGADMAKQVADINARLGKIDGFRSMSRGLDAASLAMRRAQQDASRLKAAMEAAGSPTKSMQGEYARAAAAVERATAAFRAQGQAVREARGALDAAGIPISQIARQQAQLTASLNATTAAMQRQAQAGKGLNANPWGAAPGMPRSGSGVPLISRIAPGGVLPPGAPVVPVMQPGARPPGTGAVVEVGAGIGALAAIRAAATVGMDVDTERSQARQAGWTEAEIERAEKRANELGSKYGVAPGSALNIVREARPTFGGDLDTTLSNIAPFFDVLTAMRQKSPGASDAEHNSQLGSMIKAGEILGYSSDPEKLKGFADFMAKMQQVHGSALRAEEILNFAKSGKSAASGFSYDYLASILPTMLPELGGDRLGTASMTLRQALVGGKMKKLAVENLAALGLIDESGVVSTTDDDVKGVRANAVKGSKLIETNPLEWVRTVLTPAMDQKGVKAEDRPAMLSGLFSDRNAEYLVNLLVTQGARLDKDRQTVEKALGLPGAQQALTDDPYLAAKRVGGGLANVGSALSDPFLGPLKAAADAAAGSLNRLAETARGDKAATGIGTAAGGLAGGVAAWLAGSGSGIFLRGALTAAGAAGGALGGGLALPGMVKSFADALEPKGPDGKPLAQGSKAFYGSALPGLAGDYDRSMQAQRERMRDPEAARGRAMMEVSGRQFEAVPQGEVKATLEGSATVTGKFEVQPSSALLTIVTKAHEIITSGHLSGGGPGSTGTSMPDAAAPNVGSGNPMGPR